MSRIYFKSILLPLSIACCIFAYSCKTFTPAQIQGTQLSINSQQGFDSATYYFYSPYKQGLEVEMRRPVATLGVDLSHGKTESSLGNHIVEVLKWQIVRSLNLEPDFCFYNFGGIRMHSLAAGTLYVEDAYKLLPFDNVGVILSLPGSIVLKIFETMAVSGGWPITGATYNMQEHYPDKVLIRGVPLDTSATYLVGTIDFLALGGDNMDYLRAFPFEATQILMRDALVSFWEEKDQQGDIIFSATTGNVTTDE
jgi:2',3'-cyclic-nucleotide 2'-phosphodiesterase (5'-nucleotidase family)